MDTSPTVAFDLHTLWQPDTWADPYAVYERLRPHSPLPVPLPEAVAEPGAASRTWLLLKHDEVYAVLRDHATFSSDMGAGGPDGFKLVLLMDDPPRHTQLRRLVNKAFTPRRVAELAPWITSVAGDLLDQLGHDEVDVVDSYTVPLPVTVIARLMGIPGEEYQTFKRWSDAFLTVTGGSPEAQRTDVDEMVAYFGRMAAARRAHGADDLITALVQADVEGAHLQEHEILGFCILLLIAGNETTTNLLSNALNLLAHRPDLWQRLRRDRGLVEPFIEESLRYESPVQFLQRHATRDAVVGGASIPAGSEVLVSFGAANRDPDGFAEPNEFRLDRQLNQHVAFGMGIHYCLGAPLARLEAEITLNAMLDRYHLLEPGLTPGIRQHATPIIYGFTSLPLRLG